MLNEIEIVKPMDIEKRSMAIITEELGGRTWPEPEFSIVKRCIHTSADFDYADNLCFSENAAQIGVGALNKGASIVTDTQMAASGINKKRMKECGGEVYCFMSDPDVAAAAKERECTRASICMEKAAELGKPLIIAVGNAPTALIRLYELIQEGKIRPELIIGAPGGLCKCGGSQRADYDCRHSLYRAERTKRRQQYCGDHLQCHVISGRQIEFLGRE